MYGAVNCGTPVNVEMVDALIEEYSSDPLVTQYIPKDFADAADYVFESMGRPPVDVKTAWSVVISMKEMFLQVSKKIWADIRQLNL